MKRWVLAAMLAAACLTLTGQEPEDDGTLCGPIAAEPKVHECHCAGMVERAKEQYQAECRLKPTKKEQDQCRDAQPHTCDIMDYPDTYLSDVQDGERCKRACRAHECTCSEGACYRPPEHQRKQ